MAKITRFNGNLVAPASASLGTERTLFGDVTQSDDLTDQFTADLLRGWGIVGPSDQPTLQDFNAMGFTLGQIHAYLHQMGVAEYNAAQEYHTGSISNIAGVMYVSLVDNNIGNDPALSPVQWRTADFLDTTRIDVASAATVDLTVSAPNTRHINITGTTTIAGFTVTAGNTYFVRFSGPLTLTNSASLVTQTGANILTAPGDTCIFRATAANVVEVMVYVDATVQALTASGYRRFKDGLIIQWGSQVSIGTSPLSFSLPISFPNAGLSATASHLASGASTFAEVSVSQTQVTLRASAAGATITWIAVGH